MKRTLTFLVAVAILVSAVPAFAGKVLAEIEYFYSDDGTLIGKAFNGKRVNFEYDLRGQLLAVKDAQGKDLERYTYDPAGNRLSKTINGLTTTYTYDKDGNSTYDFPDNLVLNCYSIIAIPLNDHSSEVVAAEINPPLVAFYANLTWPYNAIRLDMSLVKKGLQE